MDEMSGDDTFSIISHQRSHIGNRLLQALQALRRSDLSERTPSRHRLQENTNG